MDELRRRVTKTLAALFEAREPKHEVVWALLGDAEGTVEVPGQAGKSYCRLFGQTNLTVRAWNREVPNVADLRVDVRVLREEGMPEDYFVVGLSRTGYGGYADQPVLYVPPHGETHEFNPVQFGFDPVNVYKQAITELRATAQATPDMTVYVAAGFYVGLGNVLEYFDGDDSPAFAAAPAVGERYDLLYLDVATGVLTIRAGTAAAPGFAQRPQPQVEEVPICWVKFEAGDTAVEYDMLIDARLLIAALGIVGAHAPQHEDGGTDEIDVTDLLGVLTDEQDAGWLKGRAIGVGAPTEREVYVWRGGPAEWRAEEAPGEAAKHVHVYKENLSALCDGARVQFFTANEFEEQTLGVSLNGLEQEDGVGDDYVEDALRNSFSFAVAPPGGDVLVVQYLAVLV